MRWRRFTAIIGASAALVAASGVAAAQSGSMTGPPRLKDLKVLMTIGGGGAMAPDFAPDVTDYSLGVQSDIASVGIVAVVDPAARAALTVNGKAARSGAIAKVDLAVGDNSIEVTLTRADRSATVYAIRVSREDIRPVVDSFLKLSFTDPATHITMGYRLFVPTDYDSTKSYPLVLYLHGAGDLGSDNEIQLVGSQGATVWAKPAEQAKHSAFVLAPQGPRDPAVSAADFAKGKWGRLGWTSLMASGLAAPYAPQPELETVYDLLQDLSGKYSIDKNRIYCTGLSMGAFGTWALALAHPDTFAAIVAVCGGGDPAKLAALAKKPIWVFHAVKDPVVPVGFARSTLKALTAAGGAPKYTEYPADAYFNPMAHFAWVPAYANAEMRDWLFNQSK